MFSWNKFSEFLVKFQLFVITYCVSCADDPPQSNKMNKGLTKVLCLPGDSILNHGVCEICMRPYRSIRLLSERTINFNGTNDSWDNQTITSLRFKCQRSNFADVSKLRMTIGSTYLNGRILRAVTIEREPFVKTSSGNYSGSCFELFYAMQIKYNYSANIFLPYDGNWGAETENGTWNGMVGQVLRNEAHIGVAGFSVTLQRANVVAFTHSFHQEPTGILIPPPTEGEKFTVLIRPLSKEVWLGLLLTVIILAPTLYAMHVTSLWITKDKSTRVKSFPELVVELIHFMIGSLVQESVVSPVNKTTRFLIILWWLLAFIVANIYVAYLVSYLSAPKLHNYVNGLEDLVKQSKIKWTFRKNADLQSLFKSKSSSGVYKAIGDGVNEDDLVTTDVEGAKRVPSGKYAFIKEKSYLDVALAEDFVKTHECRMTVAKEKFFKVETALIVQKNSKILPVFNDGISRTVSSGLMEKWKSLHWPRELWCEDAVSYIANTRPKTRKLKLDDVQGAYALFALGLTFSLFSFIIELFLYRIRAFGNRKF